MTRWWNSSNQRRGKKRINKNKGNLKDLGDNIKYTYFHIFGSKKIEKTIKII